ncbi:hypothetical protein C1646_772228 [Rhizophagus diaphanus]|nr:hypothetical protein C1646_772228 [Rhizophagus diaphanus] [Rhizophagus sp. MUCL 43196]
MPTPLSVISNFGHLRGFSESSYTTSKLVQKETNNISNKEKIRKLTKEIEAYERYIFYFKKNLVSHEDDLVQLKAECQFTIYKLKKCQDHLELKKETLVIQDKHIIQLENTVVNLKKRIQDIRLFLDRNYILVSNDIDDIFTAFTQSFDEIIRQAALMQEIGVDQKNQIEGLQVLLGESLERTNGLNQDLKNIHADFTYERNGHRHWENIAQ